MPHSILAPAVLLASFSSLWIWGSLFLGTMLSYMINIPVRRISAWIRSQSVITGAHRKGSWVTPDISSLLETPIAFYVLTFALAMTGKQSAPDYWLAWAYAILRITYSLSWTIKIDN